MTAPKKSQSAQIVRRNDAFYPAQTLMLQDQHGLGDALSPELQ
ncbi:hypothetical protein ACO0K9_08655 [Undibacterium sp. Ji50W]